MRLLIAPWIVAISIGLVVPAAAYCDELSERASIKDEVVTSMRKEEFSKLELLSDTYRSSQARTSSGLWKLTLFYDGISLGFDLHRKDDGFWLASEKFAKKWVEHYPRSATARLAYARMLLNRGWSYRGPGLANTVEPQDWKPFHEFTQKARSYLETYKAIASGDPYWYNIMAVIAYQQSWPEAEFSKLIHEGLARFPSFYQIYFEAMNYYAPKWGGDAALIEKFAREALERTKSTEGFGMYARIYWSASQFQYRERLFIDSKVDWSVMKQGIDDVLRKYPDGWNINNFAKFACLAQDKAKTAELINRIDTSPPVQAWGSMSIFQACRNWALGT